MSNIQTEMILSTLDDIIYSLNLIQSRAKDAEITFNICKNELNDLIDVSIQIKKDLQI